MATNIYPEDIPYKVGKAGLPWWALVVMLAGVIGIGMFSYLQQFLFGDAVTGLRDVGTGGGAGWGLYIIMLEYFVGVGFGGMAIAALVRLLNLKALQPISRMGILLSVVCVPLAGLAVMADLGQPERAIVNLTQFVSPRSPFFGDFTLVISGSLLSSVFFLFLTGRRDAAICAKQPGKLQWLHRLWAIGYKDTPEGRKRNLQASWWMALGILPLFFIAQSTLGSVFGIQGGRPGWFGAIQSPVAIVIAIVSGVGFLAIIAGVLRLTLGAKTELNGVVFKWLNNILWVSISAYLFLTLIEMLASNYAGPSLDASVSRELLNGQYALIFWGSIGLMVLSLLILFVQFLFNRISIPLVVFAGILVNIAAIGKRLFTVIPSQTVGTMLPYLDGNYIPTWVEWGVVAGLYALGVLLYVIVVKVFPAIEMPESD